MLSEIQKLYQTSDIATAQGVQIALNSAGKVHQYHAVKATNKNLPYMLRLWHKMIDVYFMDCNLEQFQHG